MRGCALTRMQTCFIQVLRNSTGFSKIRERSTNYDRQQIRRTVRSMRRRPWSEGVLCWRPRRSIMSSSTTSRSCLAFVRYSTHQHGRRCPGQRWPLPWHTIRDSTWTAQSWNITLRICCECIIMLCRSMHRLLKHCICDLQLVLCLPSIQGGWIQPDTGPVCTCVSSTPRPAYNSVYS